MPATFAVDSNILMVDIVDIVDAFLLLFIANNNKVTYGTSTLSYLKNGNRIELNSYPNSSSYVHNSSFLFLR
jgi:hypothetical protein